MSQESLEALVWVNAREGAFPEASDRGLAYGDGVFETMRYSEARIPLLERHMERLDSSCRRLAIPVDLDQIRGEIEGFAVAARSRSARGIIKLIVTRGSGGLGYRAGACAIPTRILIWHALPDYPVARASEGVTVRFCDARLGMNVALAGIKHLNRLEQVLARMEWTDEDIVEGLMSDPRGRIVEGISTNIFLVSGGRLITPTIDSCGVAGVMRGYIMEEVSRSLGIAVATTNCERALLAGAQELFICNAVIGVWPVRKLGTKSYAVGAVTRRIRDYVAQQFVA